MISHQSIIAYINGILIRPTAVDLTTGVGSFYSFTLGVPAVPEWELLPPRSHCAVFFIDPVTSTWRLLCEGELVGHSKSKIGDGTRNRTLRFVGLHAAWANTKYVNIAGLADQTTTRGTSNPIDGYLLAQANGLIPAATEGQDQMQVSLATILSSVVTSENQNFSGVFREIIDSVLRSVPIESFYHVARKHHSKYAIVQDEELSGLLNAARFRVLIENGLGLRGFDPSDSLMRLFSEFLAIAMYTMVSVPAPSISRDIGSLRELLFIPHLYFAVPPACNVVFEDQIVSQDFSIDYSAIPTRVLSSVSVTSSDIRLPYYYMANASAAGHLGLSKESNLTPGKSVTHDYFSQEELSRGVVLKMSQVEFHKLVGQTEGTSSEFSEYLSDLVRFEYERSRGANQVQRLTCMFMPYVVPGFPILVEDTQGNFFGMVESVHHALHATGEHTTHITISHVRESYVQSGVNRTPFMPHWMNAAYLPDRVNDTYIALFGRNLNGHASAIPPSEIFTTEKTDNNRVVKQADLDELAALIVPTPIYSHDLQRRLEVTSDTYADKFRQAGALSHIKRMEYQYRSGTTLSDYTKFHQLGNAGQDVSDDPYIDPPADLSPGESAHILFSAPTGLQYAGTDGEYGLYQLISRNGRTLDDTRQKVMRTIRDALETGISEG